MAKNIKPSPYADYQERLAQLLHVLNSENIDLFALKQQCFRGVPDEPGIRPLCWKIMLNYLPPRRSLWHKTLTEKRSFYYQCVSEMVLHPDEHRKVVLESSGGEQQHATLLSVTAQNENTRANEDHPLNPNPKSNWSTYFRDNEVLSQIEKDSRRLCPEMSFFQQNARSPLYFDDATDRVGHCLTEDKKVGETLDSPEHVAAVNAIGAVDVLDSNADSSAERSCSPHNSLSNKKRRLVAEALRKRLNQGCLRSSAVRKTHTGGVTQLASSTDISLIFGDGSPPRSDDLSACSTAENGSGMLRIVNGLKNRRSNSADYPDDAEFNWEVIMRILFLHAKLNPGQSYVQGMNEIIGPIYYVLCNDCDVDARRNAEADAFFCFHNLMSEIRDNFNSHMDNVAGGVGFVMDQLMQLLHRLDSEVYKRLVEVQDLKPHFYAFRWITLLLGQEYPLPDVIRIWDTLFADPKRFEFLLYVCCSMITMVRHRILANDFAGNMKTLQNFYLCAEQEDFHVLQILAQAEKLRDTL